VSWAELKMPENENSARSDVLWPVVKKRRVQKRFLTYSLICHSIMACFVWQRALFLTATVLSLELRSAIRKKSAFDLVSPCTSYVFACVSRGHDSILSNPFFEPWSFLHCPIYIFTVHPTCGSNEHSVHYLRMQKIIREPDELLNTNIATTRDVLVWRMLILLL